LSTNPTLDDSEWITLGDAAELLSRESDSTDHSKRSRVVELLRRRPKVARLVTASVPVLAGSDTDRNGPTLLPDRCQWVSVDEIDWTTSEVRAFPLLSGTNWESAKDHMLGIRVSRAEIERVVIEGLDADERSRAIKRQRAKSLFEDLSWPVERVLLWIAFRDPARFEDDFLEAMYGATMYAPASLNDVDARRTLLRALQTDKIQAIKDGKEMLPSEWAAETGRRFPNVFLRREEVLREFPSEPASPSDGAPAAHDGDAPPKRSGAPGSEAGPNRSPVDVVPSGSNTQKRNPGAKPRFDWLDIEAFVIKTLDEKGDFDDPDSTDDWKSQNALIRLILQYLEVDRRLGAGNGPSESTLKDRVRPMINRWRERSSRN
jgi:hypothetical protein